VLTKDTSASISNVPRNSQRVVLNTRGGSAMTAQSTPSTPGDGEADGVGEEEGSGDAVVTGHAGQEEPEPVPDPEEPGGNDVTTTG
jgi:hypothetical protein